MALLRGSDLPEPTRLTQAEFLDKLDLVVAAQNLSWSIYSSSMSEIMLAVQEGVDGEIKTYIGPDQSTDNANYAVFLFKVDKRLAWLQQAMVPRF
jgi:hypothetical protein